ncbi:MAG: hypothetical protein JRJ46_04565 [Deltaproteobacteria bacterium]|nr:hypothetical protein [Deltaproteobacteria bacterium]
MKNREPVFHFRVTVLIFLILLMTGCGAVLQSVEKDKELGRETARVSWRRMLTWYFL